MLRWGRGQMAVSFLYGIYPYQWHRYCEYHVWCSVFGEIIESLAASFLAFFLLHLDSSNLAPKSLLRGDCSTWLEGAILRCLADQRFFARVPAFE